MAKKIIINIIVIGITVIVAWKSASYIAEKIHFKRYLKENQKTVAVKGKILIRSQRPEEWGTYIIEEGKMRYLGSGVRRFCLGGKATLAVGDRKFGIIDLQNKIIQEIPFSEEYSPFDFDMSADGTSIVFSSSKGSRLSDLYLLDIDTGDIKRLTRQVDAYYPRFSSDGTKIAFEGTWYIDKKFPLTVYIINRDGTGLKNILRGKRDAGAQPSWSPDDSKIVFISSEAEEENSSVFIYDIKKEKVRRITEVMDCRHPCFSPDGNMIAYAATKPGALGYGSNIFAIDLEQGGEPIRLTPLEQLDKFPRWATDEYPDWEQ